MSDISSPSVERHTKQGRSAVTNGTRALIGASSSSKYGRRYRDLVALYTQQIGRQVTATEAAMIKQAAALAIRCEMMQAEVVNGAAVNPDEMIRLSGETRRVLDTLGILGRRNGKSSTIALSEYLARNVSSP